MSNVTVQGVTMTAAAAENVAECAVNVAGDVASLLRGSTTPEALLAECLDGADSDREQGWREYVEAVGALLVRRADALALIPQRHCNGDVAYVEATEMLVNDADARSLTAGRLADRITASLDAAAAEWESQQEWTLTVHGEGEHAESIVGDTSTAKARAEELIAAGDYDLARGETVRVTYHLVSDRGARVDSSVVVEG